MSFTLPAHHPSDRWEPVLDTREPTGKAGGDALPGGDAYDMEARSIAVLRLRREPNGGEDREGRAASDSGAAEGDEAKRR